MMYRDYIEVDTQEGKFYDITEQVQAVLKKSGLQHGLCNLYLEATTAGMMINENDRMLVEDFRRLFKNLAPEDKVYQHPDNAFSHLRASMMNQSLVIPVADGSLSLGGWQNILLWEFDNKARTRKVVVTVHD